MEGFIDWNKLTIEQYIEHLENKFQFDSSGTAKAVFELIAAYRAFSTTETDKSSTTMKEEFSLLRYTIELAFIKKLNDCKWWQFAKKRKVYQWREQQLRKC